MVGLPIGIDPRVGNTYGITLSWIQVENVYVLCKQCVICFISVSCSPIIMHSVHVSSFVFILAGEQVISSTSNKNSLGVRYS